MPKTKVSVLLVVGLGLLLATAVSSEPVTAQQQSSLATEFRSAARDYGVPAELLIAMGYVNTRWEMPTTPGIDGGWGVSHLVQNSSTNTLGEASRLTGIPEAQLKTNRSQNIRGGAALLAQAQGANKPSDLNAWYDAVAEVGGSAEYANQVYETLQSGAYTTISTGETLSLAPQNAQPRQLLTIQSSPDYPRATWHPAAPENYSQSNRPRSEPINKIVIHVTQTSYSSAINWFQDPTAQVSSHYLVRSSNGDIGQLVREEDIAWHAGNWSYNETSIGIEHEGWVSDPKWFTRDMYRSSARLAAHLCDKYGISPDRRHIIGHNEIPGTDHTDPGTNWDWSLYMKYVRQYAGSGGGRGGGSGGDSGGSGKARNFSQIIDNADATTSGRFKAGSSWNYSEVNSKRYYWNYRFTRPKKTSDTAKYKFDIPVRDRYAVYGWWPSNRKYNNATPVGIKTASGWRWISVNQSRTGGRWVGLGTYRMSPRDEWKVQVSRWAGGKGYVIADAMKVVRR